MSTGSVAAEKVLDIVMSPSFDEAHVLALFNECAAQVSAKILLPALETESVVAVLATESSVALPLNFQRNLFAVHSDIVTDKFDILNSKGAVMKTLGTRFFTPETRPRAVAVVKPLLVVGPPPLADFNLTLYYHRKPTVIASSTVIDLFPDGFDELLINFALWKLYSQIEQGLEGAKVDTLYYKGLYEAQYEELRLAMKEGVSHPAPPISRGERW